jgi:WD40 repeat protein
VQKLVCPRNGVSGLTFSPDGDMLAGIGPGVVYCWTRSRDWEQSGLRHPYHHILGAIFHPNGRTLAYGLAPSPWPTASTAHADEQFVGFAGIRLYSLTSEAEFEPEQLPLTAPAGVVNHHTPWNVNLAFSPDGRMLLANRLVERRRFPWSSYQALFHWPLAPVNTGWRVPDTPGRTDPINGAALVENTGLVVTGEWGLRLCTLDLAASTPLQVPDLAAASAVATSLRGELVAAKIGAKLCVWNLRESNPIATWAIPPVPSDSVFALAFSPDGRTLAVGDSNRIVAFYDPFSGHCRTEYNFGIGAIHSLAFASDGLTLAVAGRQGLVVVDAE